MAMSRWTSKPLPPFIIASIVTAKLDSMAVVAKAFEMESLVEEARTSARSAARLLRREREVKFAQWPKPKSKQGMQMKRNASISL
jgi:hypothetical protein